MITEIVIGMLFITGTILIYFGAKKVNRFYPHPLTLPILVSAVVLILLLVVLGISYNTYMIGGEWIDRLLGPAVVALALPLYKQRKALKQHVLPVLAGVSTGSLVGISTGFYLVWLAGFNEQIVTSMIPKSVTTPVAVSIVEVAGGIPSLTAVFVILAGISGAVIQPSLFNRLNLYHFLTRGVGMGTSSHAIGTARSIETSEEEGAISTISMILSAIFVSFLVPFFIWFIS